MSARRATLKDALEVLEGIAVPSLVQGRERAASELNAIERRRARASARSRVPAAVEALKANDAAIRAAVTAFGAALAERLSLLDAHEALRAALAGDPEGVPFPEPSTRQVVERLAVDARMNTASPAAELIGVPVPRGLVR
jgi:hypothetical protein